MTRNVSEQSALSLYSLLFIKWIKQLKPNVVLVHISKLKAYLRMFSA